MAFAGGYTRGATPVPIPNTVVKPAGPMILRQRESRSLPAIYIPTPGSLIESRAFGVSGPPDSLSDEEISAIREAFSALSALCKPE
jgi:hypothetical protein